MSESNIVRARRLSDGTVVEELPDGSTRPLPDRTDWARLEAMTEEEIEANALADPDNPPLTAEELARMRPVPNPRRIRERLKLTQEQFADAVRGAPRHAARLGAGRELPGQRGENAVAGDRQRPRGGDQRAGADVSPASPSLAR